MTIINERETVMTLVKSLENQQPWNKNNNKYNECVSSFQYLVSVHSNESWLYSVHECIELLSRDILSMREVLVHDGSEPLPELAGLEDHPLPEERLRFMDAHGQCH